MASSALNIAVIGFGRMGRIYARTLADRVDHATLHAIADPAVQPDDPTVVALDVPHVVNDPAQALQLPDLHAVVIATPTSTHAEIVIAAAQAGVAIFCEKPLALSLDATREAVAAAEQAGVPLQVGFMRRFDPAYRQAKQALEQGQIGRPLTFKAIGRDPGCPDPAFADPATSGGLILDMAIHDFDLARWLMESEVERVSATGALLACDDLQAVGDIDNAVINLHFANGALGNVEVSRNAVYGYDVRTEVLGTDGVVHVGAAEADDADCWMRKESGSSRENYLMERFGAAYRAQIQDFVACVRAGRLPAVTGADALAAFELALAATFSARLHEPVTLEAVRAGWTPDLATP